MKVDVTPFYHRSTSTVSYIIVDSTKKHAVIIDSALDFDLYSGKVSSDFADQQLQYLSDNNLELVWIIDTHAHADHLSAAEYLKQKTTAKTVIGSGILQVIEQFNKSLPIQQAEGGGKYNFDRLVEDGEKLHFGASHLTAIHTPGHTLDSMSFLVDDNIFVGDTLFMPDGGTARCDFPGGSARQLWQSIEKIHALPANTRIWVCHDYQPNGRKLAFSTSVAQSRQDNIHVGHEQTVYDFIKQRTERDASLAVPKLLYPSLQVNLSGGLLPQIEQSGYAYIKIPLTIHLN